MDFKKEENNIQTLEEGEFISTDAIKTEQLEVENFTAFESSELVLKENEKYFKTNTSQRVIINHNHNNVINNEKPFLCNVCDKAFKRKSNLKVHKVIHTNEKPFVCGICSKTFKRSNELRLHNMDHNNIKPFVCDICNKAFNRNNKLKLQIS